MGKFFYSYERMLRELRRIEERYPGKVAVRDAGVSILGRRIPEVMVGGEAEKEKYHVLIQAGMHGREYLNCALVMRQIEDFLARGKTGKVCFHVLPMVNPDGVEICQSSGRERWKANGRGVDLNRNFNAGWEKYDGAKVPGMWGYKGAWASSEPEVQMIVEFPKKYPIAAGISYHSSGSLIYWDYGSEGSFRKVNETLALLVAEATGYEMRSTVNDGVDAAGCSDYFVQKCGVPAVTIETGAGECPLDEAEFPRIYRENRDVWEKVVWFAENFGQLSSSV